jgi:hypothetical protein
MSRYKISEGLEAGALDYLIKPLISIDEFESKISDKRVIVVGFYVDESDPARDLSHFIDRSNLAILDSEVSPAPTPDGYYVVFVEIQRDASFVKTLIDLVDEIENLTNVTTWYFQSPKHHDPKKLTADNIKSSIVLDQDEIVDLPDDEEISKDNAKSDESSEQLEEFWKFANVDYVILEDHTVTLHRYGTAQSYNFSFEIPNNITLLSENEQAHKLQALIGPKYAVYATPTGFIIENDLTSLYVTSAD